MKIGVLICAYNTRDTVEESLSAWIKLRNNPGPYQFVFSAVSVPFKEYASFNLENDGTTEYLRGLNLDYLVDHPEYLGEAEARTSALRPLLDEECDWIFLHDSDEMITVSEINYILSYIKDKNLFTWFGVNYKNYVFDNKTWIDGFCPPRVFRRISSGFIIDSFFWDNDIQYKSLITNEIRSYKSFGSQKIPKNLAHVRHQTWLNNEKSKRKITYQKEHFHGECSYKWNDEKNCLEFDPAFYAKNSQPLPILNYDPD